MESHKVRCDKCGKFEYMAYNGEHWLFPTGWHKLVNREAYDVDVHICNKCAVKTFGKRIKEVK